MAAVALSCSPITYTPNCLVSTLINSSWLLPCGKREPHLTFHNLCTDFKFGHVSYFSLYPTVSLCYVKIRKFENNSKGPTSSPPHLYPNETKSEFMGVFIGTKKSPTPMASHFLPTPSEKSHKRSWFRMSASPLSMSLPCFEQPSF